MRGARWHGVIRMWEDELSVVECNEWMCCVEKVVFAAWIVVTPWNETMIIYWYGAEINSCNCNILYFATASTSHSILCNYCRVTSNSHAKSVRTSTCMCVWLWMNEWKCFVLSVLGLWHDVTFEFCDICVVLYMLFCVVLCCGVLLCCTLVSLSLLLLCNRVMVHPNTPHSPPSQQHAHTTSRDNFTMHTTKPHQSNLSIITRHF